MLEWAISKELDEQPSKVAGWDPEVDGNLC